LTFPLFAATLLAAHIAGKTGALTLWGAGLHLGARSAYLPLYASGFYLIHSLVWNVASLGIGLILWALWRRRMGTLVAFAPHAMDRDRSYEARG
jgi:uncharacterized MAPEG superfamily protein